MFSRRSFLTKTLIVGGGAALGTTQAGLTAKAAEIGPDGLHTQSWFLESFLDMKEDVTEAAANGKHLAVLFEQRGCPYCKEMHEVNLARPEISSYIQENFEVVQLNLWGSRETIDFDGTEMEERKLARAWQVNFTPTIVFFPNDTAAVSGKKGREAEVARMPGYFKPFHFVSMFEFVREGAYADKSFQRYLQEKFARLEAEGKSADVWN